MIMSTSIEGVYRNGQIELAEVPGEMRDETRVIVTFLDTVSGAIDLREQGIDESEAAGLRARLQAFAEDWDSPEMDIYDEYDTAKTTI
jgi:hypothetical protein